MPPAVIAGESLILLTYSSSQFHILLSSGILTIFTVNIRLYIASKHLKI